MSSNYTYKHTVDDAESSVKLEVSIPFSVFEEEKEKVFKKLSANVKLKGFRPGKAPKPMMESYLERDVVERALEEMLPTIASEIVNELKLEPITQLDYKVTQLDKEKGINFDAEFIVFPKVELGDFSKIKVEKQKPEIEEKDIDAIVENIIKQQSAEKGEKEATEMKVSEITDKWVEDLGMDNIKTVAELRKQISDSLVEQRARIVEEEYLQAILKAALEMTKLKVPTKLVDAEISAREKNYREKIEKIGLKFEDFLRNQKTTIEELIEKWKKEVQEQITLEFMTVQIARENDIKVGRGEVEAEIKALENPEMKAELSSRDAHNRVHTVMFRQRVMQWLRSKVEGA